MTKLPVQVPDYHIHTKLCGHASGEMEDYVREAERRGLSEIGFSDHMPLIHMEPGSLTMEKEQLPLYVDEVLRLKDRWKIPAIKLGLEVDYIPGQEEEVAGILDRYEFDFVHGGVHFLGDWIVDHPDQVSEFDRRDLRKVHEDYFRLVTGAAGTGLFDVIPHMDVIKKFGHRTGSDILSVVAPAIEAISQGGLCVEVSTAGLRKPVREIYPSREILEACFEARIPITLGSDAHTPQDVAHKFEKLLDLVRSVGYREVMSFSGRTHAPVAI